MKSFNLVFNKNTATLLLLLLFCMHTNTNWSPQIQVVFNVCTHSTVCYCSQGHSSFITHLDWSVDSQYLVSNSGDYEILYCKYFYFEDWYFISTSEFVCFSHLF